VSFQALDIEQIGHVYEGLLDHTAKRATEPMLSLTAPRETSPRSPSRNWSGSPGWRVVSGEKQEQTSGEWRVASGEKREQTSGEWREAGTDEW